MAAGLVLLLLPKLTQGACLVVKDMVEEDLIKDILELNVSKEVTYMVEEELIRDILKLKVS